MLETLLLHERTRKKSENFLRRPAHALLITGPEGSGKETLALHVAGALLGIDPAKLSAYPFFTLVNPDGSTIGIEEIRSIQQALKLRTTSRLARDKKIARVIMVQQAERMRSETQNALLKTLEEPPEDTVLCLTAARHESLLPTIRSRMQELPVLPVSAEAAQLYFKHDELDRLYALSQGHAGLLASLVAEAAHPLIEYIQRAKVLLGLPVARRLQEVEVFSKDKSSTLLLLNALQRIAHATLLSVSAKNNVIAVKKWHTSQVAIVRAMTMAQKNANQKLLLVDLFTNL